MVSVSKLRGDVAAADNAKYDKLETPESGLPSDGGSTDTGEEKLKVVVRVRPLQGGEEPWPKAADTEPRGFDSALPTALSMQDNQMVWEKNGKIKMLAADAVFAGTATQDGVFRSVADCVDGLVAGFDCSVFAYGQTGTGKTYSELIARESSSSLLDRGLRGDSTSTDILASIPDNFGIVPRSIDNLFTLMEREKSTTKGTSFAVYCSFIEIYNEKIFDVLAPDDTRTTKTTRPSESKPQASIGSLTHRAVWNCAVPSKEAAGLQIRQKLDGSVFVDGMTSRNVTTKEELFHAFQEGSANRETRNNFFNQHSSRGHSVFQITLRRNVSTEVGSLSEGSRNVPNNNQINQSRLSRLFFVDLAGSEKWHMNGSDLSDRYASELSSINKSLSALTNCVLALTQKSRSHIPFRDSILTRLLQSCLQGAGRTSFIVTISPAKESLEESFATLRFAERLKSLRCRPIRRSMFSSDALGEQRLYYERQIQSMRVEVNRLRVLLKKANEKSSETAEHPFGGEANIALIEENRRLKELLMKAEKSGLLDRGKQTALSSDRGVHAIDSGPTTSHRHFLSRHMLEDNSRQEEQAVITAVERLPRQEVQTPTWSPRATTQTTGVERRDPSPENDAPRDQLNTLETQLRSKEARLNWMLEAEIEAQNAGTSVIDDTATASDTATEVNEPIVPTKSWAAETRLRRKLVAVPTPLRQSRQTDERETAGFGRPLIPTNASIPSSTLASKPKEVVPYIRPLPGSLKSSPVRTDPSAAISQPDSRIPRKERTPSPPTKETTPRGPTYQTEKTSAVSRKSRVEAASRPQPAERSDPIPTQSSSARGNEKTQPETVKSAAILKLVGSGSAAGKTREELVEDYKRARRAELEAIMRTMMVQK